MNAEQLQVIKERWKRVPAGQWDSHGAAPADIDALLAEVERLTGEVSRLMKAGRSMQEERDCWREETEVARKNMRSFMEQLGRESAEVERLHRLFESLTPGGSEFYGSPDRCAEWVTKRVGMTSKIAKERNALQAEVERLQEECDAKTAFVDKSVTALNESGLLLREANDKAQRLQEELATVRVQVDAYGAYCYAAHTDNRWEMSFSEWEHAVENDALDKERLDEWRAERIRGIYGG